MAFPQVVDRVTSEEGGGTTTHGIDLPATVDAGDLLVAFYGQWESGDYGTLWPPEWEPFAWDYNSSNVRVIAAWKEADGSEGGTSITVRSLDANESSHVVYRITGHGDTDTQPPEGRSFFGPASYRGLTTARDFRTALAVSHLPVEAATEDPPSYTYVSSDEWTAATVAVPPASSGTFPTLEGRAHSINGSTTSHTVDLPGTINSGDLLIGIFGRGSSNDDDVSWPAGWTEFASVGTPSGDGNRLSFAYRQADGTEGASITVTTTASGSSSHVVYRLTGAADPSTTPPEASTTNGTSATPDPPSLTFSGGSDTHLWLAVADHKSKHGEQLATGTSTSPDPPSLTPTGGAKDYLWIAACEHFGGSNASGAPTDYTNLQTISDFRTAIATAERELNASSEDPGTFTFSSSDPWVAATALIHPAGTGGTTKTLQLSDQLDLSDTAIGLQVKAPGFSDQMDLTDVLDVAGVRAVLASDQVDLTDLLSVRGVRSVQPADSLDLSDALTVKIAGVTITLVPSDELDLSDQIKVPRKTRIQF